MARIAGVDLPRDKRIEIGLTYIYGIGNTSAAKILEVSGVNPDTIISTQELATLGVDSLAFSWILADMEDTFDFVMRGSDIMKLKTLATAVDYVEQHVGK